MTEWLTERFCPGPFFAWLCVVSFGLIVLVWLRACAWSMNAAVRFSSLRPLQTLGTTWVVRTRFILSALRTLAILALIVALARPHSGGAYQDSREGIAIQMLLDVSGSMAERDFVLEAKPVRRLDAVKRVFGDFVLGRGDLPGRENDLIGMTVFAMYADTRCPLTLDHGSLRDLLRETEIPGWIDGRQTYEHEEAGYTALGDAIAIGTDDLCRAGQQAIAGVPGAEPAGSRVIILLTDGKNNPAPILGTEPPDPLDAARVAATLGIRIYTIGAIGSGDPQRAGFDPLLQPRAEMDEPLLMEIARVSGGKYFRATDTDSLVTIYDEIDRLERRRTGKRTFHDNLFAARVAMLTALVLLMTELLLANTWYRRIP